MRIGFNPQKDKQVELSDFFHQIIIPVYIPNQEGYFKDSLVILKYCLESLFRTSHSKTYFTVVNNGSCKEIISYLNELQDKGQIQELIHTTNIGKLNAILKGLTGQNFQLITIADSDVLFLNDWQKATYEVFKAFPKTGAVSPVPNSRGLKYYTSNVIFDCLFSDKLKFTEVKNPQAMIKFAESIGNENFFNEINLKRNLTIGTDKSTAVVGAGHFVATYRKEVFDNLNQKHSSYGMGGDSEESILDKPVAENGFWRLSTSDNYAFHLGNVTEDWMKDVVQNLPDKAIEIPLPQFKKVNTYRMTNWIKSSFFSKIIFRKPFWLLLLRYKGLSANEANNYNK